MPRLFPNGIDVASQRIQHMADGTAADDAASWGQVQALLNGLSWKKAVRVATTTNGTLATAYANGSSVDGQTLATGDRILLKNQTTTSENGIYTVNASGAPTRATDADSSAELNAATVYVMQGTANADTSWNQTVDNPTVGTTGLVWAQIGTGGTTYTAGNGLQLVTTTFSVKLPGSSGLVADGTGLYIDTAIVVRKYAANFGDGSTTSIAITHSLGSKDCQVNVFDNTSNAEEYPDVVHTSTTVVTLTYAVAPASAAKRVVVQC
jgi:hypothetical protein